jgi:hypothetical protein
MSLTQNPAHLERTAKLSFANLGSPFMRGIAGPQCQKVFYTVFLYWDLKIGPKPAKLGFLSTFGPARIPAPAKIR